MGTILGFSKSPQTSTLDGLLIEARQKADEKPLWAAFANILEGDIESADAILEQYQPKESPAPTDPA